MRRDHDDFDLALRVLVDPQLPPDREDIVDGLRVGFLAHAVAEARVLRAQQPAIRTSRWDAVLAKINEEHRGQHRAMAAFVVAKPHSADWFTRALELRILLLDHASRHDMLMGSLLDDLSAADRERLAACYATERLRMLAVADVTTLHRPTIVAKRHRSLDFVTPSFGIPSASRCDVS